MFDCMDAAVRRSGGRALKAGALRRRSSGCRERSETQRFDGFDLLGLCGRAQPTYIVRRADAYVQSTQPARYLTLLNVIRCNPFDNRVINSFVMIRHDIKFQSLNLTTI
ncbi:MAG: hypothetical protein ACI845_003810 [Gammaproteobacteria bacterium]